MKNGAVTGMALFAEGWRILLRDHLKRVLYPVTVGIGAGRRLSYIRKVDEEVEAVRNGREKASPVLLSSEYWVCRTQSHSQGSIGAFLYCNDPHQSVPQDTCSGYIQRGRINPTRRME